MATQQEVVLRPGDTISVRLEVPGQPLRLDLSLTPEGVTVSQPMPMGAPTMFGGVRPPQVADMDIESETLDLTAEFAAQDSDADEPAQPQSVESLAAVEPFGDTPQALDIPFEEVEDEAGGYEPATHELTDGDDLDLDLNDLGGEEEVTVGLEIPAAEPFDISLDEDPGFSADARTMVPPTRAAQPEPISLSLDAEPSMELGGLSLDADNEEIELDADGNPKEKFRPGPEDTLPVWTGKASTYRDPEIEKKRDDTSKLNKSGGPAAKKPPTKSLKKPTAAVGKKPAAPAPSGGGNFTVFLSPPKGAEKKQAAAEIIADIQGIDLNSALSLAGKMIVPVVKGVSEEEASGIRDRFKDAGLSCRITQKR